MRKFGLRPLLVLALFTGFLQIGCSGKGNSSANSLVGTWEVEKIVLNGFNGGVILTLKPSAGEVCLRSDGKFNGYFLMLPEIPNGKKELSGKATINPKDKTIELTEDDPGSEITLYKYRLEDPYFLEENWSEHLILERVVAETPGGLGTNWQMKINLKRKAAH